MTNAMREFYFTISSNQIEHHWPGRRLAGGCVKVVANNASDARVLMYDKFESAWAFQCAGIEGVHELDREILYTIEA